MIRFRLYRVPVGFHLSALFIALFGLQLYTGWELAGWTVGVLAAVLLHEAGHAYTALTFGAGSVSITLFALGGFTTWAPEEAPIGPGKRFAISASGSAAGIVAGLLVVLLARSGILGELPEALVALLNGFVLAALVWGLLNWIPVLPLDGGHMTLSLLDLVWPERSEQIAKGISVVVGGILVAVAVYFEFYFAAVFLAIIVVSGIRSRPAQPAPDSGSPPPSAPASDMDLPDPPPGDADGRDHPTEPPEFPI